MSRWARGAWNFRYPHGDSIGPPSKLPPRLRRSAARTGRLRASMAGVSRKTYAIEDSGPYDEDEAREKIRAYCDEHGFFAAATLTVVEMSEDGGTSGRRVDAGQFLDGP